MNARLFLHPSFFREECRLLLESGALRVSLFRYSSGVEAAKLQNAKGELTILPYKGMQIWRATFLGHNLAMRTMFEEPAASNEFLKTYGGFLLHCGLTGIGSPSAEDTHAHHGELPNAPFGDAAVQAGEDEKGRFVEISGTYQHLVGFTIGYAFTASYRLYENATTFTTTVGIENLRSKTLPYLYLCHINFVPVDGSRLLDTASHERYTVHDSGETTRAWAEKLREDITAQHAIGNPDECYDPEICVTLEYAPDEEGRAHTMQLLPDGYAHYVSHSVAALPIPVRWISRTGDEDALGMVLPATAEHLGRANAEEKGQLKFVEPHGRTGFTLECGLLEPGHAENMVKKIAQVRLGGSLNGR